MIFCNLSNSSYGSLRVCVIGSGPSGFYTAQRLLRQSKKVYIDMLEAKREPFGLIRYGVAPDHPEVKNCTSKFKELLLESPPRLSWHGGVTLGTDVKLDELIQAYHAVVIAVGAQLENRLNIPGEHLAISSRSFTHWMNGDNESPALSLSSSTCTSSLVIGNGNVALDVARSLIGNPARFSGTCIGSQALKELKSSTLRHVAIVGRRGPLQSSFSAKELREIFSLCRAEKIQLLTNIQLEKKEEAATRTHRLLLSELSHARVLPPADIPLRWQDEQKTLSFIFCHSPAEFTKAENIIKATLRPNIISAVDGCILGQDGSSVVIPSALIVTCLGYGVGVIPGAEKFPRVHPRGPLVNEKGLIDAESGLFAAGWTKTGPAGALASTMLDAYETADSILYKEEILKKKKIESPGWLEDVLRKRNVGSLSFSDWARQN